MFESTELGVNALGYSPTLIWEWFQDMGFEIFTPDRLGHDAPAFDLSTFLDSHAYPVRTQNYFAVHRDNRLEIRDRARKILNIQVTK